MNPLLLPVLDIGAKLIDRWFPDPEKKAAAEFELLKMTQDGELKQILAQLEINAKEAQHPSVFVSGGRPAAIWVCVAGLAYAAILHNILEWIASIVGWPAPPAVDIDLLGYILGALLGIGTLRTVEKTKGVASK